ncbi:MAG: sortase [Candidatus Levybacteria bacterium]|nr:sortase [Candidatus Levybacteria bacterium]
MTRSEAIKFVILRSIGNFLVLLTLYVFAATFGPVLYHEAVFQVNKARGIQYTVAQTQDEAREVSKNFGDVLASQREVLIPQDTTFGIVIPKIGANAKIFPNVDPTDEKQFLPILKQGVAHAKGTVFPGMDGNIYLFAHSTDTWWSVGRYNAVFYLLKELSVGDDVVVFFKNKRYDYKVSESFIAEPSDVSFLINSQRGPQKLILQTCWPPGTAWKRLFIIATPKNQ